MFTFGVSVKQPNHDSRTAQHNTSNGSGAGARALRAACSHCGRFALQPATGSLVRVLAVLIWASRLTEIRVCMCVRCLVCPCTYAAAAASQGSTCAALQVCLLALKQCLALAQAAVLQA